ncbi:hypothetical protein NDU88_006940 [Pleurodeles waltl]|uniref:Uncharacterized protein n=1 Tax=Pleurodeles waltl TaxID=8319 RepID=A0AAV7VRB0_PLEWA|nr:hypothetical protein NDU88_006940 [Pleurodeles waltl]
MYSYKPPSRRSAKGDVRSGCGAPVRSRGSPDRGDQYDDEGRPKQRRCAHSLSAPAERSCRAGGAPGPSSAVFMRSPLEGTSDGGDPQLMPEERTKRPAVSGPAKEHSPWWPPGASGLSPAARGPRGINHWSAPRRGRAGLSGALPWWGPRAGRSTRLNTVHKKSGDR